MGRSIQRNGIRYFLTHSAILAIIGICGDLHVVGRTRNGLKPVVRVLLEIELVVGIYFCGNSVI